MPPNSVGFGKPINSTSLCVKAAGRPSRRFCRFWDRTLSPFVPLERRVRSLIQHRGVNPSPVHDVAGDPDGEDAIRRPIPRQGAAGVGEVVHDGASGGRGAKQRDVEGGLIASESPTCAILGEAKQIAEPLV
jgi:hypothetical protein